MEIKNTGREEVNLRKKDRLLSERRLFLKGSAALGKENQALHKRSAEAWKTEGAAGGRREL